MKNKPKKQKTEKVHLLLAIKINKTKLSVLGRTFHETYLYANLPKNWFLEKIWFYLKLVLEKGVDVTVYTIYLSVAEYRVSHAVVPLYTMG